MERRCITKTPLQAFILTILLCVMVTAQVRAQTTALTYQGLFTDKGAPFTGSAEFQFTLWNAASGGESVAANNPASVIVEVTNGLFTLALDFGDQVLDGADRFLQIEARTSIGPFTALTPRQRMTAVPYAVRARSVSSGGLSGGTYASAVTFNNTANSFTGHGAGLTSLDASQLSSGSVPAAALGNAWKTGGNAGTTPGTHFLGTTDNQPLEFKVNGLRALRLEDNGDGNDEDSEPDGAPNVIGGSPSNLVDPGVVGVTISGGGATNAFGSSAPNSVGGHFGTIGGGAANRITTNAVFATIAGGVANRILHDAPLATIAGGSFNAIGGGASGAAIGGGAYNGIWDNATYSVISGGSGNAIDAGAECSVIPGGFDNRIGPDADYAFAAGHRTQANHPGSFIWADSTDFNFRSNYRDKVRFRCTGGFDIVTAVNEVGYETNGVYLLPNGSSWISISSRNAKKNFQPVDTVQMLETLAAIPITRWNYNSEADDAVPHLGPMAEDFKGAFFPGRDDKGISTLEFDGVALAAIQGLNRKLEQKLQQKEIEITQLNLRLEKLEELLHVRLSGGAR